MVLAANFGDQSLCVHYRPSMMSQGKTSWKDPERSLKLLWCLSKGSFALTSFTVHSIHKNVIKLFSDDYWERRYSIKADQIPAFLHANVDKILRTGKYLNVIQQCEQSKAKKTYYKAERSKPRGLINPFKKPSDVTDAKIEDDTEDLRYFENPGMYRTRYGKTGCGVFNGGIKN